MYNHFGVWNCLVFDCDRPRPVMIVEWLYNQMVAVRQVMMGILLGLEWESSWYPLVNIQKAIENVPFIVDLPIENGDFP